MCWKDFYILNTQDVLVNVGASAEFNEDNSHFYIEAKLQ